MALIALAAFRTMRTEQRIDLAFTLKSVAALVVFLAYCVAGVLLIFALSPVNPGSTLALVATLFALTWIGFGGLWLIRMAPRTKQPPAFLDQPFGLLGKGFLAVAAACLFTIVIAG